MEYFVVAVDDNFKDDALSGYLQSSSGRFADEQDFICEVHRIGSKGALSEDLAKRIRVELGKMILEGKCRSWNQMKVDLGVMK